MSIVKNTLYYSSALVCQKVLGFIYFALIARGLGVEVTGQYLFALSFTTIFAVLADIGMAPVLTREIAKDKSKTQKLFAQVFSVKLLISILTYGLVVLFVNLLGYPDITKTLVYIAGAVMLLDSFSLIFWAVFRGQQNLKFEARGVIGHQTITVILGLTALYLGLGVKALLAATLAASLFYALYSLSLLIKKLKLKLQLVFDKQTIYWFLKTALPFALAGVFARIYTQIDTIMLSKIGCATQAVCDAHVGWYGAASKVTLALQFIPLALAASLFPAFSEQFLQAKDRLKVTYEKAWRYLAILVIPLVAGVIVLAPEIVRSIWGPAFLPAVLPMQILMVSLIFIFLTFPNGALLNAAGQQLTNTLYMGVAVVVNVTLNIYLILNYQMTGAAIASIASTFVLFTLGFIKSYKLIKFNRKDLLFRMTKLLVAGVLMTLALLYLKSFISWVLLIPTGAIIYFVAIWLLGELRREDLLLFYKLLHRD